MATISDDHTSRILRVVEFSDARWRLVDGEWRIGIYTDLTETFDSPAGPHWNVAIRMRWFQAPDEDGGLVRLSDFGRRIAERAGYEFTRQPVG